MKTKILVMLASVCVLCCASCSKKEAPSAEVDQKAPAAEVQAGEAPAAEAPAAEAPAGDVKIEFTIGDKADKLDEDKAHLAWQYPTFGIESVDNKLEEIAKGIAMNALSDFKDGFKDQADAELNSKVSYETVRASADEIDIAFKLDVFVKGTAHPNAEVFAVMLDPKTGKQIFAKDLEENGQLDMKFIRAEGEKAIPGVLKEAGVAEISDEEIKAAIAEVNMNVLRTDKGYRVYINPGDLIGPYREVIAFDVEKPQDNPAEAK